MGTFRLVIRYSLYRLYEEMLHRMDWDMSYRARISRILADHHMALIKTIT